MSSGHAKAVEMACEALQPHWKTLLQSHKEDVRREQRRAISALLRELAVARWAGHPIGNELKRVADELEQP